MEDLSSGNLDRHRASSKNINFKAVAQMMIKESRNSGKTGHNEPMHAALGTDVDETQAATCPEEELIRNRAMLHYIAHLAKSNSETDTFSYTFVQSLIDGGANLNEAVDAYGQTIFHEVARSWNLDVATFLLNNGANINQQDKYGRSPLHVCAASDHYDMVEFLLQNGADIDSRSMGDGQTPLHYAAKNDATRSLHALLGFGANIDSLDNKERTALQVASELSRSETARILVEEGASSCLYDVNGSSAMTVLVEKLPHLALEALDQLHVSDRISRCDKFYLNLLEESRQDKTTKDALTPLETAVNNRKFAVLMHPVMQRLVNVKWLHYGRFWTIVDLFINLIYAILFTIFAIATPGEGKDLYYPIKDNVWRLFVGSIIILVTTYQMYLQIKTTYTSREKQISWIKWRLKQLKNDLEFCHPKWQEEKYVRDEMKIIKNLPRLSSIDNWFFFDWFIIILILVSIALNFSYYFIDSSGIKSAYLRALSVLLILVWLRIMKYLRPFPGIGTLVLILGSTGGDFVNWGFFFMLLFIPFTSSYWIIFGGSSYNRVSGFTKVQRLIYTMFQISVGEDFNIQGLSEADDVMARLLSSLFITCMVIICLNILIAYLSNTFTTVYSKAVENTNMQRAINILNIEKFLPKKRLPRFYEHLRRNANPDIVPWSPIVVADKRKEKQVAMEIENSLNKTREILKERFNRRVGKGKLSTFDNLLIDVQKIKAQQTGTLEDLIEVETLLDQLGNYLGVENSTLHFSEIVSHMMDQRERTTSLTAVSGLENNVQDGGSQPSKKKVSNIKKIDQRNFNEKNVHDERVEILGESDGEEDEESHENGGNRNITPNGRQFLKFRKSKSAKQKDIKSEDEEEEIEDDEEDNEKGRNKKIDHRGNKSKLKEGQPRIRKSKSDKQNETDEEEKVDEVEESEDDAQENKRGRNKKMGKIRAIKSMVRKSKSAKQKGIDEEIEEDGDAELRANERIDKTKQNTQTRMKVLSKLRKTKSVQENKIDEEEEGREENDQNSEEENYLDNFPDKHDVARSTRNNDKKKGKGSKMPLRSSLSKNKNMKMRTGSSVHFREGPHDNEMFDASEEEYQEANPRYNRSQKNEPSKQSRPRSQQRDRSNNGTSLSLVSYQPPTNHWDPNDFAAEFLDEYPYEEESKWEKISIDSVSL